MRAKNYYIDPRSMLHDNNSCKLVNALSPEKKKKRKEATEEKKTQRKEKGRSMLLGFSVTN